MMRARPWPLFGLVVLLQLGGSVFAQSRPDLRSLTCDEAVNLVQSKGKVIFTTGDFTYEQIVSTRRYCQPGQVVQTSKLPTVDEKRCWIGYTCRERERR